MQMDHHRSTPPDAVHVRLDHRQGKRHRHRGINGVPSSLEHVDPNLSGEGMIGRHHALLADRFFFADLPGST